MCRRESPVCSIAPGVLLFFLLLSLFLRKSLTDFSGDKIGIFFIKNPSFYWDICMERCLEWHSTIINGNYFKMVEFENLYFSALLKVF